MIARVLVYIPFKILVPKDERFDTYSIEDSDYNIIFYPPGRDQNFIFDLEPKTIKVNGREAFYANYVQIDFCKNDFNRSKKGAFDPSFEKINEVLNFFLLRLRRATRAPQIHPLPIKSYRVGITYFNDDGTGLLEENGKITQGFAGLYEFKFVSLNKEIWDDTFSNSSDFSSQHWTNLLLDAMDELPDVGPAVVLAFSALELFISDILNQLATNNVSPDLRSWINSRQKEPKTEEQYDTLLKIFTGHSLKKDEPKLWDVFYHLKSARDTFVHGGIARITRKSDKLELIEAQELILQADVIILKVREWLPKEIQWELPREFHDIIEAEVDIKFR